MRNVHSLIAPQNLYINLWVWTFLNFNKHNLQDKRNKYLQSTEHKYELKPCLLDIFSVKYIFKIELLFRFIFYNINNII